MARPTSHARVSVAEGREGVAVAKKVKAVVSPVLVGAAVAKTVKAVVGPALVGVAVAKTVKAVVSPAPVDVAVAKTVKAVVSPAPVGVAVAKTVKAVVSPVLVGVAVAKTVKAVVSPALVGAAAAAVKNVVVVVEVIVAVTAKTKNRRADVAVEAVDAVARKAAKVEIVAEAVAVDEEVVRRGWFEAVASRRRDEAENEQGNDPDEKRPALARVSGVFFVGSRLEGSTTAYPVLTRSPRRSKPYADATAATQALDLAFRGFRSASSFRIILESSFPKCGSKWNHDFEISTFRTRASPDRTSRPRKRDLRRRARGPRRPVSSRMGRIPSRPSRVVLQADARRCRSRLRRVRTGDVSRH